MPKNTKIANELPKGHCVNAYCIAGIRSSGYFALKTIEYDKVHNSAKVIDLKLKEARGGYLKQFKQRR